MGEHNRKSPMETSLEKMLAEWLPDPEAAANELQKFRPKPKDLSSLLERAVSRCIKPWTLRLITLQNSWQELMGKDLARKCSVTKVEFGVVYIEVRHPAFLPGLKSPRIQSLMLEKIHTILTKEEATEIQFIATGSFSPLAARKKQGKLS